MSSLIREKRIIGGKSHTVEVFGTKIINVLDPETKTMTRYEDYLKDLELREKEKERKERKEREKEKQYDVNEPKLELISKEAQKIKTRNTSTTAISTSGTAGIDILVPNIKVNVNTDTGDNIEKDIEKDKDPYNWYIRRVLRRDII